MTSGGEKMFADAFRMGWQAHAKAVVDWLRAEADYAAAAVETEEGMGRVLAAAHANTLRRAAETIEQGAAQIAMARRQPPGEG